MTPKRRSGLALVGQALADQEDAPDFDALERAVVTGIDTARSAREVAAVLTLPPLDEATLGGESGHPPAVVEAVWRRVWARREPAVLSLASRLAVFDAWWPEGPSDASPFKQDARDALALAAPQLRSGLQDAAAAWRTACALALGRRAPGAPEDLAALAATLRDDVDPHVAAAAAWALAALGGPPPEADAVPFVAWAAAAARARAAGVIAAADAARWVHALGDRRAFPAASGWRCPGDPPPSPRRLALLGLLRFDAEAPEPLVRAACRGRSEVSDVADVLWRQAFGSGRAVPAGGVTRGELSGAQRAALAVLARDPRGWHRFGPLGLAGPEDVRALLEARGPAWRPLAVRTPGGLRRSHLWHLWRAVVWGELDVEAAADALARALPEADVRATFADPRRSVRLQRVGQQRGPEHAARDQALRSALEARWAAAEGPTGG